MIRFQSIAHFCYNQPHRTERKYTAVKPVVITGQEKYSYLLTMA